MTDQRPGGVKATVKRHEGEGFPEGPVETETRKRPAGSNPPTPPKRYPFVADFDPWIELGSPAFGPPRGAGFDPGGH